MQRSAFSGGVRRTITMAAAVGFSIAAAPVAATVIGEPSAGAASPATVTSPPPFPIPIPFPNTLFANLENQNRMAECEAQLQWQQDASEMVNFLGGGPLGNLPLPPQCGKSQTY